VPSVAVTVAMTDILQIELEQILEPIGSGGRNGA
jgi:hypothetical protein